MSMWRIVGAVTKSTSSSKDLEGRIDGLEYKRSTKTMNDGVGPSPKKPKKEFDVSSMAPMGNTTSINREQLSRVVLPVL